MRRHLFLLLLFGIITSRNVQAQYLPAGSHAVFQFAHLADGGPSTDKWISVFRFLNPNTMVNLPVTGRLWFFDPQGVPLMLDFGSGPVTTLPITIPAMGSTQLKSTGASPTLRTGTVRASFDSPVLAVEEFQNWRNGVFVNGASVPAAGITFAFQTYADRYTGIAVSNPLTTSIYCNGRVLDANGTNIGGNAITLAPLGQASFTVGNLFSLAASSSYSYQLECHGQANAPVSSPLAPFTALAIAGDNRGITSSLPPGDFALPSDRYRMIWNAFYQLVKAFNSVAGFQVGQPQLQILTDPVINAKFDRSTNTVSITLALVELFADSPSEVAWAIAHELGHARQYVTGTTQFNPNPELDADMFSLFGLLLTGYDAYAAGGGMGKLMMASGRTGLLDQYFDNLTDIHTSFSNRMGTMMDLIQAICSLPAAQNMCSLEHNIFHPHMPQTLTPLITVAPAE